MSYLSISFLIFTIILTLLYYLLPSKWHWKILLLGSLIFYLSFNIKYFIFLLFVAASTYYSAKLFEKNKHNKLIFISCIIVNTLLWGIIKVLPWSLHVLSIALSKLNITFTEPFWNIIVPIGISYYLLQALSYLIDAYKGKIKAENNFFKYLLFLSYFPAIVQGPISRYDKFMPELLNTKKYSSQNTINSLILILFGLIKKIVLADRLGLFVNNCFSNYQDLHGIILYIGAIFYSLQLYLDFSGCVDICRGISRILNIELINNFNRPYFSMSIKEFWSKWHISLSNWLKDYIYIPLGGNRKGKLKKYLNIIITFLVSGIWHGAGFSFIFWGFLHGLYQIIGDFTKNIRLKIKKLIKVEENSFSDKVYKTIITFNLVTFAWIFFRSPSFLSALNYIKNMFVSADLWVLFDNTIYDMGMNQNFMILIISQVIILFVLEFKFHQDEIINKITHLHIILRWTIYILLIMDVVFFGVYGSGYDIAGFMYGGF